MKPGSIYTVPQYRELVIVGVVLKVDSEFVKATEIHCSASTGELLSVQPSSYRKRSEIVDMVEQPRDIEPVAIVDVNQVVSLDELRALWPNPKTAAEEAEEEGLA